ncbi:TIGR04141 family sporadically distributed protein [Pseudomonas fluorescens]|nr:TIGR04141 family sporadically distributed protein [Pseudomonas fluorescens]
MSDADFRKKLRKVVSTRRRAALALLPAISGLAVRADYTVVYGVMRNPYIKRDLDPPFFSKVSLQAAVDRIEQLDIPVALEIIAKPAHEQEELGAGGGGSATRSRLPMQDLDKRSSSTYRRSL